MLTHASGGSATVRDYGLLSARQNESQAHSSAAHGPLPGTPEKTPEIDRAACSHYGVTVHGCRLALLAVVGAATFIACGPTGPVSPPSDAARLTPAAAPNFAPPFTPVVGTTLDDVVTFNTLDSQLQGQDVATTVQVTNRDSQAHTVASILVSFYDVRIDQTTDQLPPHLVTVSYFTEAFHLDPGEAREITVRARNETNRPVMSVGYGPTIGT